MTRNEDRGTAVSEHGKSSGRQVILPIASILPNMQNRRCHDSTMKTPSQRQLAQALKRPRSLGLEDSCINIIRLLSLRVGTPLTPARTRSLCIVGILGSIFPVVHCRDRRHEPLPCTSLDAEIEGVHDEGGKVRLVACGYVRTAVFYPSVGAGAAGVEG